MKIIKRNENGFVLILSMVWLLAMTFAIAAIMFSVRQTNQSERNWIEMDECFFYAQSVLGRVRISIEEDFKDYLLRRNGNISAMRDWYTEIKLGEKYVLNESNTDDSGLDYPTQWKEGRYICKFDDKHISNGDATVDLLIKVKCDLGVSSRIFEEHFRVELTSNPFDYAYFINNKGWMYGSSISLNGDVRANGDFEFKYNPTVNGDVYASWNYERSGVRGDVIGAYKSDSRSNYDSRWLRYRGDGKLHVRDMAAIGDIEPGSKYQPDNRENGRMPAHEGQEPLAMPYLGELDYYIEKSKAEAANGWSYLKYKDAEGVSHVITSGFYDGKGKEFYDGKGPDRVANTADDNVLVITGEIEIMGPVVVTGDVIIKGTYKKLSSKPGGLKASDEDIETYLTAKERVSLSAKKQQEEAVKRKWEQMNGKGGLFSGRNVHIIGNVKSSEKTNGDTDPFLSLAARGSVIAGPHQSIDEYYINGFCQPYSTQDSEYQTTKLTYTDYKGETMTVDAFDGDYTQLDYDLSQGGGIPMDGYFAREWYNDNRLIYYGSDESISDSLLTPDGKVNGAQIKINGKVYDVLSVDKSKRGDWIRLPDNSYKWISGYRVNLGQSIAPLPLNSQANRSRRYYEPSIPFDMVSDLDYPPTQVDSVLFTNHVVGGYMGSNAAINGSIVGRDEAFRFSGSISMNWDQRLRGSSKGINQILSTLLPKTFDPNYKPGVYKVLFWREVFTDDF